MSLLSGLQAYYRLEGANNAGQWLDYSANALPLTVNGSASASAAKIGDGLLLAQAATPNYLYRAHNAALAVGGNDFTVAGWIRCTFSDLGGGILARETAGDLTNSEFSVYVADIGTAYYVWLKTWADDGTANSKRVVQSFTKNVWSFFAVGRITITGTTYLFASKNGGAKSTTAEATATSSKSCSLYLGYSPYDAQYNTSKNFAGQIDELGLWNRGLSDTELTELYNSGRGQCPVALPGRLGLLSATTPLTLREP